MCHGCCKPMKSFYLIHARVSLRSKAQPRRPRIPGYDSPTHPPTASPTLPFPSPRPLHRTRTFYFSPPRIGFGVGVASRDLGIARLRRRYARSRQGWRVVDIRRGTRHSAKGVTLQLITLLIADARKNVLALHLVRGLESKFRARVQAVPVPARTDPFRPLLPHTYPCRFSPSPEPFPLFHPPVAQLDLLSSS